MAACGAHVVFSIKTKKGRKSHKMFRIFVSQVKFHFLVDLTCTVFLLVACQFYYRETTVVKQSLKFIVPIISRYVYMYVSISGS